jgi:hypothetical protein
MTETTKIAWNRIAIEAIAIVGSILLAFAIDAWWDHLQERGEEREILSALLAEFEANKKVLAQTAEVHRLALNAMQDIVSASKSDITVHAVPLGPLFRLALVTPHYNPATGALAVTIDSGRLGLVRNVELRNRLAGWNAVISDLVLDEQTRRDFVTHVLHLAFAEFGIAGSRPGTNDPDADFSEALRSRQIMALLRSQIRRVAHLVTHFDDAEDATQAMISDLAEELRSL